MSPFKGVTRREIGLLRAAGVRAVISHPGPARDALLGRNFVGGVVQPDMPLGGHARGFGRARVDDPAALLPQRISVRKPATLLVAVVDVPLCIPTDFLAPKPGENARHDGIAHAYP